MTVMDSTASRARAADASIRRADGSPVRVLVVDDEPSLAELLASVLRYEGWEIQTAADGSSAVRAAREFQPDAIVLDIMLPDFDGLEVLRRVRAILPHVCVLFLTARDAVQDRVSGITAGGDDYVTKPFSLEEVLARLRGLLRRAGMARASNGTELTVADLAMDEDAREVRRGGDLIDLTATEFELLRFMMRNPRRVLSKAQILDRVWNYDFGGQAHVVELYISYLRKKIDSGREPTDPHRPRCRLRIEAAGRTMTPQQHPALTTRVRGWLAARTLRGRLVAGLLALLALACATVGVVTYTHLHSVLISQLDTELSLREHPLPGMRQPGPAARPAAGAPAARRQSPAAILRAASSDGRLHRHDQGQRPGQRSIPGRQHERLLPDRRRSGADRQRASWPAHDRRPVRLTARTG